MHRAVTWLVNTSLFIAYMQNKQGINSASSFFTSQLTTIIGQILIGHMIAQHVFVVILTNMWSIEQFL